MAIPLAATGKRRERQGGGGMHIHGAAWRRGAAGARAAALAITAALALTPPAPAQEPGRRAAPEISALQAAEAEARPMLPAPRAVDVPILVYHHVLPGRGSSLLFVSPEGFEQQLKYLRDNGYRTVTFGDLADCLEYGAVLPERPVILSFDDGWENQYQYAFPLLRKYGFAGTFYVVSGYLDHPNFMTTDQLKTMIAGGMTIGSHSRSHPALPGLGGGSRLKDEIAGSKAWLEQQLGVPIDTFAYPYGAYTASVVAATKAAGYRTARTVDGGTRDTLDNLETLPGIVFPAFASRYRATIELAASDTRR
jgi:peptidoglycan/xylan/chitin deacetylase (PgdA/CDA1 family)